MYASVPMTMIYAFDLRHAPCNIQQGQARLLVQLHLLSYSSHLVLKETFKPGCPILSISSRWCHACSLSFILSQTHHLSIPAFALFRTLKDMLLYLHNHFVFMIPQTTIFEDYRSAVHNSQNLGKNL